MFSNRQLDHLVYAVPDLEVALDWFEDAFGIRPVFGGCHLNKGTKNALLNLGEQSYLEIIAVDQANKNFSAPRWMGVDGIIKPTLTRWAIKSTDLTSDSAVIRKYNSEMGAIAEGERKTSDGKLLAWEMVMPLAEPVVEPIPFMVDWQRSAAHPTDNMPQQFELLSLEFTHPQPAICSPVLKELGLNIEVVKSDKVSITARIKTPKGIVKL